MLNPNIRRVLPGYLTQLFWNVIWSISITGPVMPLYVEALGISVVEWGALAAVFAVGMFLFEWVWGSVSDRANPSSLMVICLLCMSAIFALCTIHGSFLFFAVLQLFGGAFGVTIGPTTRTYVSEESPSESVGMYASLWWAFAALGRVIGPLAGTYIAQAWSFEFSFYTSSALSVVLALVIFWSFPRNRRRSKDSGGIISKARFVLHGRSALHLCLAAVFAMMGFSAIQTFLPLYAFGQVGMSTVEIGELIAAFAAVQLVAMPVLGWLSDRFGQRRVAVSGFLLSICSFLLYFMAGSSYQIFLVTIAVGVGLSGASLFLAMIPDVAPKGMFGTTIGLYGSFEDLGVILGPLLYGFMWSAISPISIFAASSLTQVLCVLLVLRIEKKDPNLRDSCNNEGK